MKQSGSLNLSDQLMSLRGDDMTNCPNCGAPISGIECKYCGTTFFDLVDISTGRDCIVRLRHGNVIITGKMRVSSMDSEVNYADPMIGRDLTGRLRRYIEAPSPTVTTNIEFISLGEITIKEVSDN